MQAAMRPPALLLPRQAVPNSWHISFQYQGQTESDRLKDKVRTKISSIRLRLKITLRYRLSTYGRRAFSVAGPTVWNSLPEDMRDPECSVDSHWRHFYSHITTAPSLSICCRLKSHLFSLSYPAFRLFSHLYSARAVTRHFGNDRWFSFSYSIIILSRWVFCPFSRAAPCNTSQVRPLGL